MYQYKVQMINHNMPSRHYTLQHRLNTWLEATGTTKAELSRACQAYASHYRINFSKTNIAHYSAGRCCPKSDTLAILSHVMGVSEQWLTGYGPESLRVTRTLVSTTRYTRV